MKAFKDLKGKIPAKDGDRVALVRFQYGPDLIQRNPLRRPIMFEWLPTFNEEEGVA